ncbi:MAG: hypothetical protein RL701_3005 [Pseudomonadota bacterium]
MSKRAEWIARVAEWRASGLTAAQFCTGREYAATSLYWWSRQLKGPAREARVDIVRVVRKASTPQAQSTAPIVVQLGQARIEVAPEALAALLEALAASAWASKS